MPGLWLGAWYWAFKLGDSFVEAVFYANSIAPAMMLALAAIVAFRRRERGEGRGWLCSGRAVRRRRAVQGVHRRAAGARRGDRVTRATLWLAVALAVPAALAVLVLVLSSGGHGTAPPVVALEPLAPTNPAREPTASPPRPASRSSCPASRGSSSRLACAPQGCPARGVRCAAAPPGRPPAPPRRAACEREGRGRRPRPPWMAARPPRQHPRGPGCRRELLLPPGERPRPLAVAAPAVASLARRSVALAAVAAVSSPSCPRPSSSAHKSMQEPLVVPAASCGRWPRCARRAAGATWSSAGCASQRCLSPVVLAGRRVALADYIGYWRQFTTLEALEARRALVREFFQARDPASAEAVAARLGAGYVHLHGAKAPVEEAGALVPLFAEGDERVYRIDAEARAGSCRAGAR